MRSYSKIYIICLGIAVTFWSCGQHHSEKQENAENMTNTTVPTVKNRLDKYTSFKLNPSLDQLSDNQRKMVGLLIQAADIMNDLFWYEAYGKRDSLMEAIKDKDAQEFVKINYGPWDRLDDNAPFVEGVGPKPLGANFYPEDMTKAEFEQASLSDKADLYTFIRRDEHGQLQAIPYHEMFAEQVQQVADLLRQAAQLAEDPGFAQYLKLRAEALLTDNYQPSDMAWMDMKNNAVDLVIGPIETYEDQLFGYKAAHEAYVLIKDQEWSDRLAKYAKFLPKLQQDLPVPAQYKKEIPGSDADLNAYDVAYYAGDCNAGSKTIAINLPNDEEVQLKKGTRRLQLKNAMRAKYDKILVPLADVLIDPEQRKYVSFDAFFANTMFHEVAHGLGIKNTINNKGTVREALKEHASALEEGKADVLGLFMVTQLHDAGELEGDLKEFYTTFLASIFRSIRFGASSAHGAANMIRFNYFKEKGAFARNDADGTYHVNYDKMQHAMNDLSHDILTYQGNGDYEGVAQLVKEKGIISEQLQQDLNRLSEKNIPVDVVFEQGLNDLGLTATR